MRQSIVRIGVIGAGSMGRNHVRILSTEKDLFEFVGIYDADPARAKDVSGQYSVTAFSTAEALMEQVDAVVIAVPSSLHRAAALEAAGHGLHALVEKPLALTQGEAVEIAEAFRTAGRILAVGHVERYNPVVTELYKLLQHEQVLAAEVRRYGPFNGRITDADVVQDLMIHDIDLICNVLFPEIPYRLSAVGSVVKSGRLDLVQSLFRFENGAIANVSASRVTENKIREIAVHTNQSFIVADLLNRSLSVTRNTNLVIDAGKESAYRQDSVTQRIFVPMVEPLRAELLDFHRCITQECAPAANGAAACRAISICEEIIGQAER